MPNVQFSQTCTASKSAKRVLLHQPLTQILQSLLFAPSIPVSVLCVYRNACVFLCMTGDLYLGHVGRVCVCVCVCVISLSGDLYSGQGLCMYVCEGPH